MKQDKPIQLSSNSRNLAEVSFMRPILVILLVLYHAFIVYNNGWEEPAGFSANPFYKWLDRSSYAFLLESFVFISGYIWSYQRIEQQKQESFGILIKKKIKRLIIPSILFSILYILLFSPNSLIVKNLIGGGDLLLNILSGAGHLWFLPALFWCFLFIWIIEQFKLSPYLKFIGLLILSILSFIQLPLRLDKAMYFLLFFYGGYFVRENHGKIQARIKSTNVLFLWLAFVFFFIVLMIIRDKFAAYSIGDITLTTKIFIRSADRVCQIIYSSIGVLAFYFTSVLYCRNNNLSPKYIEIGKYCFAVYIFQQFILKIVYYHSEFPVQLGPQILPIFGFVFTLILSVFLAKVIKDI